MGYKEFLSETKAELKTRLDYVVHMHELKLELRSNLAQILKVGLSSSFQAQFEYYPTIYGIGIAQQMDDFSRKAAEVARKRMEEHDGL